MLRRVQGLGLWLAIPYLGWILYLLLDPGNSPIEGLNLEPLHTLRRQYAFQSQRVFLQQVIGNIGLLLPFGLLAVVWGRSLLRTLFYIAFGSVVIEAVQYSLPIGRVADIDDVILNVLGGLTGWLIGWPLFKILGRNEAETGDPAGE